MALFCVGLTGGIGCGKSTVADRLAALGASVIDTDEIARMLTAPNGRAITAIREAFGPQALTPEGAMDRLYMRKLVFGDSEQKARLEAILHPMVRQDLESQIALKLGAYVVLVVPLLAETNHFRSICHTVVTVTCPVEIRVARVMARSGLTEAEVLSIVAAQATDTQRLAISDERIDNSRTLDDLSRDVDALHRRLLESAHAGAQE